MIRWSRIYGFFGRLVLMFMVSGVHYLLQVMLWVTWRRKLAHGDPRGPLALWHVISFPVLWAYKILNGGVLEVGDGLEQAMVGNSVVWGLAFVLIVYSVSVRMARKRAQVVAIPVAKR